MGGGLTMRGRGANSEGLACGARDGAVRCESGDVRKQLANFVTYEMYFLGLPILP